MRKDTPNSQKEYKNSSLSFSFLVPSHPSPQAIPKWQQWEQRKQYGAEIHEIKNRKAIGNIKEAKIWIFANIIKMYRLLARWRERD